MKKYRIIAADDNTDIKNFYKEYLSEEGFDVSVTDNGTDLLRLYKDNPSDLVIMDTLDKKITYPIIFSILRQMNPDVKILFISGLQVEPEAFEKEYQVTFMEKPLTEDLTKKVLETIKS